MKQIIFAGITIVLIMTAAGLFIAFGGGPPPEAGRTFHVIVYSGGCEVARYRALGSTLVLKDGVVIFEDVNGRRVRLTGSVVVEEVKQP